MPRLWPGKLLVILLLTIGSLSWMEVKGNTLRLTHAPSNSLTEPNYPQELSSRYLIFSRGSRSPNDKGNPGVRYCQKRLLDALIMVCRSPVGKGYPSFQPQAQALHSVPHGTSSSNQDSRLGWEGRVEDERNEDFQEEAMMDRVGGIRMKKSVDRVDLPRNVVDECCNNPCQKSQLLKYCGLIRPDPVVVTIPTTTTTPTPPQFRSHRLVRMRTDGGAPSKKNVQSSQSTVEEIRQQIIQDAIQCLVNPACAQLDEDDDDDSLNVRQRSRFSQNALQKPKNKPSLSSKNKTKEVDLCPSQGRRKSKRLQRLRKQQQETSRLIPLLLKVLAWWHNTAPTNQPAEPSHHIKTPSERNPVDYDRSDSEFRPLGNRKSQMTVVTDAPMLSTYIRFPLDTNDGISFSD